MKIVNICKILVLTCIYINIFMPVETKNKHFFGKYSPRRMKPTTLVALVKVVKERGVSVRKRYGV